MVAHDNARSSDILLRAVLGNISHGIVVYDEDLTVLACNAQAERLFDLPPGVLVPERNLREILRFMADAGEYPGRDFDALAALRCSVFRRRESSDERRRPGGRVIENVRRRTPEGWTVVVYSDVTTRANATAALGEAEERFRTLVEHAPEAVLLCNVDSGQVLLANPSAERLFARTRDQLQEGWLADLFDQDGDAVLEGGPDLQALAQRSGQEAVVLERRHRRPDGTCRSCELRIVALPSDDRAMLRVSVVDITERQRAEQALKGGEARLANAVRVAGIGVWELDIAQGTFAVNDRAREILELPDDGAEPSLASALARLHPEDRGPVAGSLERLRQGAKDVSERDYRILRSDGEIIYCHGRAQLIRDSAGRPVQVVGSLLDLTHRVAAEQSLRQLHEQMRAIAAQVPGVVYRRVVRPDGQVTLPYVGGALLRRFGLSAKDVMDDPALLLSRTHPEDLERLNQSGERAAQTLSPLLEEFRAFAADGSVIWLRAHSTVHRTPDGSVVSDGLLFDVTENRQVQDRLRQSESLLRNAQRLAKVGAWVSDFTSGQVTWSEQMNEIFGLPEDLRQGPPELFLPYIHPEDREQYRKTRNKGLRENDYFDARARVVRPDGTTRVIRSVGEVETDKEGRHRRMIGATHDITELTAAEETARRLGQHVRAIASQLPGAIFRVVMGKDGQGRLDFIDGQLLRRQSLDRELSLALFKERIHPDDRRKVADWLERLARTLHPADVEYRWLTPDGQHVWVRSHALPSLSPEGEVVCDGVSLDVTERRRVEAMVSRMQRMDAVGKLAGGIAHDFNNLLGIIHGNLSLMQRSLPEVDPARQRVETAMRAADRGAALTGKLLGFTRQETGAVASVDVNEAIGEMRDLLARSLTHEIDLVLELDPKAGFASVVSGDLQDALLNLVVNSRDAMPEGGRLCIATRRVTIRSREAAGLSVAPGIYVQVSVSDTGSGILPDDLERVVEPFYTTKPPGQGTGLGLSLVYGFVRRSGGDLRVESSPGQGTNVHLLFPCQEGQDIRTRPSGGESRLPRGSECILVVDDEPELIELASLLLADLGYRVLSASCGADALALLRKEDSIDLLFTDIIMPGGLNGVQLAREARRLRPSLPVLFNSGYAGSREHESELAALSASLLPKPYNRQQLAAQVRRALDGAGDAIAPAAAAGPL